MNFLKLQFLHSSETLLSIIKVIVVTIQQHLFYDHELGKVLDIGRLGME